MKKLILLILVINLHITAYNQIVSGTIYDKETKKIIDFASIYFNGTFVGTNSDKNGHFELEIAGNESKPLTISALGYYSVTFTEISSKKPLIVNMMPKTFELNDVVVAAKSLTRARKRYLEIFRSEFLGSTENGEKCEIINEKDITFNYGSCKDTLRAFASKPLVIYNNGLGYKITYYLDNFEYRLRDRSFSFNGNIIFNEDWAKDETKKQLFEERRKSTFLGSRIHFFRELWANDLFSAGFKLQNTYGEDLAYNKIVIQGINGKRFIKFPEKLCIIYSPYKSKSYINFLKDQVFFDASGYADLMGISWEGDMAMKRIADWLPYEYGIK
jgi:hypothetical protein